MVARHQGAARLKPTPWWSRPTSAAWCAPAALAKRIDAPLAIVDKRRERPGESEVMNIIGDVAGRSCILIDDIVDSGGTLVQRRRCAARQGRQGGLRLHHPWRALRRRGGAHRQFQAQGTGDHRFDPCRPKP
jgi:orotate phosphoribosyltransferase